MSERPGPIEARQWPRELSARAVTDAPQRRMFGYDVEEDLARHYGYGDLLYLSLRGELPSAEVSRAFSRALMASSAMSIAEAPIHAAALARICGARTGGVVSAGVVALGERADAVVRQRDAGEVGTFAAVDERERAAVARLLDLVRDDVDVSAVPKDAGYELALAYVLRACGLGEPFQTSAALVLARLPSVLAEAGAVAPGSFKQYPLDTPHFEYTGEDGS